MLISTLSQARRVKNNKADPDVGLTQFSIVDDVYAFALLMHEILLGVSPYHNVDGNHQSYELLNRLVEHVVKNGERPNTVEIQAQHPHLAMLMRRCWANSPSERPPMEEVCEILDTHETSRFEYN